MWEGVVRKTCGKEGVVRKRKEGVVRKREGVVRKREGVVRKRCGKVW